MTENNSDNGDGKSSSVERLRSRIALLDERHLNSERTVTEKFLIIDRELERMRHDYHQRSNQLQLDYIAFNARLNEAEKEIIRMKTIPWESYSKSIRDLEKAIDTAKGAIRMAVFVGTFLGGIAGAIMTYGVAKLTEHNAGRAIQWPSFAPADIVPRRELQSYPELFGFGPT